MTRTILRRFLIVLSALLAAITLAACNAGQDQGDGSGQDGEHSFAGKTVTVVIGLDASAGGTTVGRLLAKHLEENLAGNPTVIVNNMPGASALNAHLHVLLRAPNDGTTVYYGPRSSLGELLQLPGFTFKYSQFTPLGGVQLAGLVIYARTDAVAGGVSGAEDVIGTETLRFGGMPPEHGRMIISSMGLDLLGVNYKYIAGYPSSGNIRAAMISGEVNVATDAAHAYLNQVVPVLIADLQHADAEQRRRPHSECTGSGCALLAESVHTIAWRSPGRRSLGLDHDSPGTGSDHATRIPWPARHEPRGGRNISSGT